MWSGRILLTDLTNRDPSVQYSEELRLKRQQTIVDGVRDAILAKRACLGHPELMANTILGMSALLASRVVAEADVVTDDLAHRNVREPAVQAGYAGFISVAYYKDFWDANSTDDSITQAMSEVLHRQFSRFAWEDLGIGICAAFLESGRFGVTIVVAVGAIDGSAQTVASINRVRGLADSDVLHQNYALRKLARRYIEGGTFPEKKRIEEDLIQSGYVEPGHIFRCAYLGTETRVSKDPDGVHLDKMGDAAANALLQEYRSILLRSDWQDIGIATRNWLSTSSSSFYFVQAEFIIAWQLPESVERPAHFPPPLPEEHKGQTWKPNQGRDPGQVDGHIGHKPYRPVESTENKPGWRRWLPF